MSAQDEAETFRKQSEQRRHFNGRPVEAATTTASSVRCVVVFFLVALSPGAATARHGLHQRSLANATAANSSAASLCQTGGVDSADQLYPIGGSNLTSGQQQQQWHYEWNQNSSFGYAESKISDFVRPTFYTLRLKVDPTKRKFTGQLMIALEVGAPSVQQAPSVDSIDELLEGRQQQQKTTVMRNKNGQLGHRYLSLNAGPAIHIRKAFYVYKSTGSVQIPATRIGRSLESDLLTLDFYPNVITSGQGLLLVVYAGQVNETDSQGLFVHHSSRGSKSSRQTGSSGSGSSSNNKTAPDDSGLATHMQPNFARRLFPSWDEPHLKARFNLIVVLPFRGYQTISNMPIKRKSISLSSCSGEPLQEIEFQTTPTMSTYLLTLVIGRFDRIESITASNCKVSAYVYANHSEPINLQQQQQQQDPEQQQQAVNAKRQAAQTALEVAVKSFDKLEQMLGVKYPLQKFDIIALREFNNGGMENWGASIFHENYLLLYESAHNSTTSQQEIQVNGGRQRPRRLVVPLVVAHEIAHQWFGNLLTSASWTYLWLNEGFAQLFMYELADSLFPEADYWLLFLEDARQAAMHEDELFTTSHALEFELSESSAASLAADQLSLFDQLTYNKGAMMVRMLKSLLFGSQQFLAGLRHYLLKHSYEVVSSRDLLLALEESQPASQLAGTQLEPLMQTWLRHEGFPLISVQVLAEETHHFRLRLSQERFTLMSLHSQQQEHNISSPNWSVPILFAGESRPMPGEAQMLLAGQSPPAYESFLLADRHATISLPKSQVGNWFKLNAGALGFYRVDYLQQGSQVDMLQRMRQAVRSKALGPIDRFNLVDDLFAMVRSARKPSGYFLRQLADSFDEETEVIVVRSIVDSLRRIETSIVSNSADQRLHSLFDRYVQKYLRKVSQSASSSMRRAGINNQQQQHSRQQQQELQDLIDGALLASRGPQQQQPSADELVLKALDLFGRHFRPARDRQPLDWMDRELRASIYATALAAAQSDPDLAPNFSLADELKSSTGSNSTAAANTADQQQQPTAADPILGDYSSLSPVTISTNSTTTTTTTTATADDTFLRLLRAYALSESSAERYAICAALGSIGAPNKQLKLLDLALFGAHFRQQDTQTLLEAMARQKSGRQLIWQTLKSNTKTLERRQLLPALLKSLWQGFIDPSSAAGAGAGAAAGSQQQSEIENFLRTLYQQYGDEHGKLLSQTIELIRINSHWFKRDHDELLQFLLHSPYLDGPE